MIRGMRPALCRAGAVLALSLALTGTGRAAPVSYNVNLLDHLPGHVAANDAWGYTAPNGTELAIYGHRDGTAFVDATDPMNAVEIFNLPGPTSGWRDVKTYQNYAYIVTEGSGTGTGLQIVDLVDPLNPVHIGTYTLNQFTTAHNIWIDEAVGIAYACGASPGGGMHILSLADPENPVEIDFFNDYYIHDIFAADGRAYSGAISAGALTIIDVTNPATPATLSFHSYPGATTHSAWPVSSSTHCISTDETGGGHLKIWDITNLSSLSLAAEWEVPYEPAIIHNALIRDDIVYMSYYAAGTHLVDLTDPANPVPVGWYDTTTRTGGFDGCWGIYPYRADNVYYASDRQNGLFILEFTGGFEGEIAGMDRDAGTSATLDGATLELLGVPSEVFAEAADGSGAYGGFVSGGTYDLVVSRFGYVTDTTSVMIPENGVLAHDVLLMPVPSGSFRLEARKSGTLDPVVGAVVTVSGTPFAPQATDAAGVVTFDALPTGTAWNVRIGKFGREVAEELVAVSIGDTTDVSVVMAAGFLDDFEFDQAWTIGDPGDDATDGLWARGIPSGSFFLGAVEPTEDASPTGDGFCLVTEPHGSQGWVGLSDVDGGKTTTQSPVFDGTGLGDLTLRYQRWFSNRAPTQGTDEFRADVSFDGGSNWINVETLSTGAEIWSEVLVDLSAAGVPTTQMRLRFVAEDLGEDHYVEAAVDEVEILSAATGIDAGAEAAIAIGTGIRFEAPRPNPFREGTSIEFRIPQEGQVVLGIYDVGGRRVATLLRAEILGAGTHRVRWSGVADDGRAVSPGVYFARLEAAGEMLTRKLTRLR